MLFFYIASAVVFFLFVRFNAEDIFIILLTVPILDKSIYIILRNLSLTVNDSKGNTDNDTTNKSGYIIVPVIENDNTDGNGGVVEENKDNVKTQYTVIVENSDGKISDAAVTVADGEISVKLPDTHTLTTSNQTKVTVLDKNAQPVKDVSVTVTDKNNKTATKTTDTNGQILVPVKTSGGGGGSSSGGGGSYISTNTTNVKVTDKDGKTVNISKSIDKDGKVTLTLPNGKTLTDNYYVITVTDGRGNAKPDTDIILKDKKYDITGHPKYRYLSDANPKNTFDIEKYLKCKLKVKKDEVYEVFEVNVSH